MILSAPLFLSLSALAADKDEVVREIERGLFVKSNIGSTIMVTPVNLLSGVMTVQIGLGQEFIDKERFSVGWEAGFHQSLFNGPEFDVLAAGGVPAVVQGDIHVLGGLAGLEASFYPVRRLGVGIMAQGGVFLAPVLMDEVAYQEDIVQGVFGGVEPVANAGPIPVFGATPTIEYYTKLSHFSLGADVAVLYWLNVGLAIGPTGYLKYTF
jgi:hypothetical protein